MSVVGSAFPTTVFVAIHAVHVLCFAYVGCARHTAQRAAVEKKPRSGCRVQRPLHVPTPMALAERAVIVMARKKHTARPLQKNGASNVGKCDCRQRAMSHKNG